MPEVKTAEVRSRLGDFTLIRLGQTVLISQCDTRMRILAALCEGPLTSEELRKKLRISYSSVMDHMEFFETVGLVRATLIRKESGRRTAKGRRRITFHLHENPLEGIEKLFMNAPRNGKGKSKAIPAPIEI